MEFRETENTDKILNVQVGAFKRIVLIGHARTQMEIRRMTEQDVIDVLLNPDESGLTTQPGRQRVRKHKNLHTSFDIVYEEHGDNLVVVTAIRVDREPKDSIRSHRGRR